MKFIQHLNTVTSKFLWRFSTSEINLWITHAPVLRQPIYANMGIKKFNILFGIRKCHCRLLWHDHWEIEFAARENKKLFSFLIRNSFCVKIITTSLRLKSWLDSIRGLKAERKEPARCSALRMVDGNIHLFVSSKSNTFIAEEHSKATNTKNHTKSIHSNVWWLKLLLHS